VAAVTSVIRVLSPRWAAPFAMADFSPLTTYQGLTAELAPTQLPFSLCLK
jgi:hypothetical protein